jgi:hypothetical protein
MPARATRRALAAAALLALVARSDCRSGAELGCLGNDDPACIPPIPCQALAYTCADGYARLARIERPDQRPRGPRALAALGDYRLENDRLVAVIDALDHPHHLAATGGNLLDLAPRIGGINGTDGPDELNQISVVTGILPRDAPRYTALQPLASGDGVALLARGHLDGDARATVLTRYELRPCEPGLRVRTEVYDGGRDVFTYFLADVFFWGDRGATPFVPLPGQGFAHPELDLAEPDLAWRTFPWMAASTHSEAGTAYAMVPCDAPMLEGVHDQTISGAGLPRTIVRPGDGLSFERFIMVAPGPGLAGASSLALEAHAQLHGGALARVHGRVLGDDGAPIDGDARKVSLSIEEGDLATDARHRTPWGEAVPAADGTYAITLPEGRSFVLEAHRLGRAIGGDVAFTAAPDAALPDVIVPRAPVLTVTVRDADDATPIDAELVLVPRDASTASTSEGSLHGAGATCAPFLGAPHGGSPACNRALVHGGAVTFDVPPGRYWLYATAGLARTLARAELDLRDGDARTIDLTLRALSVFPARALQGDFHVHGARSFDTGSMPDRDRVLAFAAAGVDVIVATDHDVIGDYGAAARALGLDARLKLIDGAETTQMIPWAYPPGIDGPTVIGHFNFWPLPYDPASPRNGLPSDEFLEPGALFDLLRPRIGAAGVSQLNHPLSHAKIFRDEGYLRMLDYRPTRPLPGRDDGSAIGRLWARPGGGARNLDWDVQEAMNGADVLLNLAYRAQWHAFLSQGVLRAGTANSDSHSLIVEGIGYPRNVVLADDLAGGAFDRDAFDALVKRGALIGTNGPFLDIAVVDDAGRHAPQLVPFAPRGAATLSIAVRAAPWIPVEEIRVIVDGVVARRIPKSAIAQPSDPFGASGVTRYEGTIPLAELGIEKTRDAWIVVEAGLALPATADDDGDGLPDRFGAPGDGTDFRTLPRPTPDDPRFSLDVVAPGSWPFGYTNPIVLDFAGDGFTPPGL